MSSKQGAAWKNLNHLVALYESYSLGSSLLVVEEASSLEDHQSHLHTHTSTQARHVIPDQLAMSPRSSVFPQPLEKLLRCHGWSVGNSLRGHSCTKFVSP